MVLYEMWWRERVVSLDISSQAFRGTTVFKSFSRTKGQQSSCFEELKTELIPGFKMCCEWRCLSPDILVEAPESEELLLEDTHLRSVIEEEAFKLLSQQSLLDRPSSPSDGFTHQEQNNHHVLGFPRKLWQIVESPEFKSIWWDEGGTSIVIDVEQFQTEVLEMKGHFRIFETCNMKSFVRQLNLYGFRKMQSTFPRSASLFHFMPECCDVLGTSKVMKISIPWIPSEYIMCIDSAKFL